MAIRVPALKIPDFSISHSVDYFDRIPDSILLVIFNKICDVKALGRCSVVSRRFQNLVPLVDNVLVRVDCVISGDHPTASADADSAASGRTRGVFLSVARLVIGSIVKPLQALGQILRSPDFTFSSSASPNLSSSDSVSEISHHSPTEVLKNFKEIRMLKIELPAGELGVDDGVLLKWRADFGSTLQRCVILGASSLVLDESEDSTNLSETTSMEFCAVDESGNIPESFYMNGSLKLRVVWTISSLIAASARHFLLHPIINDHETLENLDLTDANEQGVLTMNKLQMKEVREKPVSSSSSSSQRTLVPALSMKLWYASHLEIPGGILLKGATLVAIRPSDESLGEDWDDNDAFCDEGSWVSNAFAEPYRTAAKMLVRRKMYSLEMNSF